MDESGNDAGVSTDRRAAVLDSALTTFIRFGYRKASMDDIAAAAHISRPGLYFLFASKEELFRASVVRGLDEDLAKVERILGESDRPIRGRLAEAFDHWAGRYIGAGSRDLEAVIEDHPDLLGQVVAEKPERFEELLTKAVGSGALAQTLISVSVGIKHQVHDRSAYRDRLAIAIDELLR